MTPTVMFSPPPMVPSRDPCLNVRGHGTQEEGQSLLRSAALISPIGLRLRSRNRFRGPVPDVLTVRSRLPLGERFEMADLPK